MQTCELDLGFKIGHYNGSMSLEISYNNQVLDWFPTLPDDSLELKYKITLPGKLEFKVANKNINTDTQVDDQGKIIADKYVILKSASLGRVPIQEYQLHRLCLHRGIDGDVVNSNFWGKPGTIKIDFNCANVVTWHFLNTKI